MNRKCISVVLVFAAVCWLGLAVNRPFPAALRAAENPQLDPIAETADQGRAQGDYVTLCVGHHPDCAVRGASTDTYLKQAADRYPGAWGWMDMCRVGARTEGNNHWALLYFDLGEVPAGVSIRRAVLRLSLPPWTNTKGAVQRFGAFLVDLPDSPGWDAQAATAADRKAGTAWPAGGVQAASHAQPVAVGKWLTTQVQRRNEKRTVPAAIEFDLTGAVRAWVQKGARNCGILLDNRLDGGAYDFYCSRCLRPERRPQLQIELSPGVRKTAEPLAVKPALPEGDYWVEPMRAVHQRFRGKAGTLVQYGDSITTTMAFLALFAWGEKIEAKNCPADVRAELDLVQRYSDRKLWRQWKGAEWGNTGMMRSDWLLKNVDSWQKKLNPEAAVILFGTNDIGNLLPPEYTENMAAALQRMMVDGTVPMLTTVPPKSGADALVYEYWLAGLMIARHLKVPVIDYYSEILRRRPDDWDGRLEKFPKQRDVYQVPTLISGDGTHPSNPKEYVNDFSQQALDSNGYGLRNYMTLRMYAEVIQKVLQPAKNDKVRP